MENMSPNTKTTRNTDLDTAVMEKVACCVCLSLEATFFKELEGYRFYRCHGCTLVYMSPRPHAKTLRNLYDEHYFCSNDPRIGYEVYEKDVNSLSYKSSRLLADIERHVSSGRILDIGCAHGFLLRVAREKGWEVEGIEPASTVAERVQEELGVMVHGDLFKAGFAEGQFDAITMWDVVEHLPNLKESMLEIRRILRRGGILSIVTPDLGSFAARLLAERWEEMRKMPEHIYFFNRRSLRHLLEAGGFTPLEWSTVGKLMPLDEAASRMVPTRPHFWKPVLSFLRWSRLSDKVVYLDPRWKMSVLAQAT